MKQTNLYSNVLDGFSRLVTPQKIVLFDWAAQDSMTQNSDLDFIAILNNNEDVKSVTKTVLGRKPPDAPLTRKIARKNLCT